MTRGLFLDERQDGDLLRALERGYAWRMEAAHDADDALKRLRREPPDLFIATMSATTAHDFTLLRRFRAERRLRRIPFIVFSDGVASRDAEEQIRRLGVDAALIGASDSFDARVYAPPAESDEALIRALTARVILLEHASRVLRDKEAQMWMALRAGRMGTWEWDVTTDEVTWTAGYDEASWSPLPRSFHGLLSEFVTDVHPEDREAQQRAVSTALETHTDYEHEYRVVQPGDNVRWVVAWGRPFYDESGRPERMVGTFMDCTNRRRRDEQLLQSRKMEAIGQLAGGIAHDFNNILSAIIGNTSFARHMVDEHHPLSECLEEIDNASQRAKSVVQQILAFSRKQRIEKRVVALPPLLSETATLLRAALPSTAVLTSECAAEVPPVLADSSQLHQVVLNLATNAWHALGGKRGTVAIALHAAAVGREQVRSHDPPGRYLEPGRYVRLSVSDSGSGMDARTLTHIFEPFFTTKPTGHGTGLGLSVVAEIVRDHGGAITVTSEPGRGSMFELYLPASDASVAGPDREAARECPQATSPACGARILYIDDEESLVRNAVRLLSGVGYQVEGFTRVEEAMAAYRAAPGRFQLLITDLTMPDGNGEEVAHELLSARPDLPVILTSGFVTDEVKQRTIALGDVNVLHKPVDPPDLISAVQRALRGS
jgi:signal transduction histidine kinase/ActR/RegA family two-component response regulator